MMAAFHSDEAFERLKTLPKVKGKEIVEPNSATKNFRAFRKELVSRREALLLFVVEGGRGIACIASCISVFIHP